ncbi:MAG: winged helix-turn-helix domain-containing protein [Candidatus Woesearchaeota archaeon]
MSERRNRLDIVGDILRAIQAKGGKIKPTHLLYKSNLSHEGMKKYVEELKQKGLIEEIVEPKSNHKFFTITDKGLKFLEDYKKVKEFTESFGI